MFIDTKGSLSLWCKIIFEVAVSQRSVLGSDDPRKSN
jgi:hypothetical protein